MYNSRTNRYFDEVLLIDRECPSPDSPGSCQIPAALYPLDMPAALIDIGSVCILELEVTHGDISEGVTEVLELHVELAI